MALSRENYLNRTALAAHQRQRLHALFTEIQDRNDFYRRKFAGIDLDQLTWPQDLARLPFTAKEELTQDQLDFPPYGLLPTYTLDNYNRLHQTSGTSGKPLRWLDTPESWQWLLGCWDSILRMAGLKKGERLFFPFSFGPFLGFWSAFDAASRMGFLCLPGGGMSSNARLQFLLDTQATVLLCTPTYALRLVEAARDIGFDLNACQIRSIIVAGEPGGSIPATRQRIESAWGARVFDHYGLTEVGPMSMECQENPHGSHVLENEYVVEVIDPISLTPIDPGQVGELVVTNLGRWGGPVIRYRTGDLAKIDPDPCPCGRSFVRLQGGILGRTDDMMQIRGNNVYPAALENLVQSFAEVAEFQVELDGSASLAALRLIVEPAEAVNGSDLARRLEHCIRDKLLFRAEVQIVSPGTLPRFELKAKRFKKK